MSEVVEVVPVPARARAEAAFAELVDCVDAAMSSGEVESAAALLVDMVRASSELRLRSERELGRLLALHPDRGGRSPGRGPGLARRLREVVGTNRTEQHWLVRLSELDDATWQAVLDAVWSTYPRAAACAARHVVLAGAGDPTLSIPGGESAA